MSRSKFIKSNSAKESFTTSLPAGRFSHLQLTYEGTTDAGQTLELDDLGTLVITDRGQELQRMPVGVLNQLADLKGGYPAKPTGNAATAERVVSYASFGYSGFPNVLAVNDQNEIEIRYIPSANIGTKFGANAVTLRIEAWENFEIVSRYKMKIASQNQQASAAGTINDNIQGKNLVALLLRDPDSVVSELNAKVGDKVLIDNAPFSIVKDETNIINRIESADNELAEVAISQNGVKGGTFNNGGTIQTTFSGAGTMELYKVSFEWLSEAQVQRNRQQVEAYLRTLGN